VRRRDRPRLAELPKAAEVVDTLITPAGERHVTVIETAVSAGGSGGPVPYTLPSECEVCFVLHGRVEVSVEDEVFPLDAGDALTFGASVPHNWRALGDGARILWILPRGQPDPLASVR
jgi:quercetin dioxygenase-like cupin family protein